MFIDSKTNDQNMRVLNSFMITLLEWCLFIDSIFKDYYPAWSMMKTKGEAHAFCKINYKNMWIMKSESNVLVTHLTI